MKNITRRSILAGLASAPLLSNGLNALSKNAAVSPSVGTRWLYAYIHGAFVLDIQAAGVCLMFPKVPGSATTGFMHEYRAGYLPNGQGALVDQGSPLALVGFAGAKSKPELDDSTFPYFKKVSLNKTSLYYSVTMPMPNSIVPLRQVQMDQNGDDFFPNSADLQNLEYLPLAIMLEFEILPGESPELLDGSWSDDGRNPLVIHFRGEPGIITNIDHNALPDVAAILNTTLTLDSSYSCSVAPAKNDEEKTLLELRNLTAVCAEGKLSQMKQPGVDAARGSHPANCVGIGNCPTCT